MMNTTKNNTKYRTRVRGAVLGVLGLASLAGGCESVGPRRAGEPGVELPGLTAGNQGGSSDVIFASPRVNNYYIAIKPEVLEELRRRDRELAIYDRSALTALEREWPHGPRPSLEHDRITRSQTRDDRTFIYYEVDDGERRWDR